MTTRRAATLVEILVVIAVIAVLLALLTPVFNAAKLAAYGSQETSQLRSLGVAHALYEADNDDRVLATSIPLINGGYVPPALVRVPFDPYPNGWANDSREHGSTEIATKYKDSFITLNMSAGAMFHDRFRESAAGGWLISAGSGLITLKDKVIFSNVSYKRLTFTGSVIARKFAQTRDPNGRVTVSMDRCFSDDPIIDDFLRNRR